ncbi:MAG: GNAT family N-acetyltransferase, partial [Coriobacteriia bacterium]|nr:GNAT family N-acetyltransferase [Coriobacteriia bacterium]
MRRMLDKMRSSLISLFRANASGGRMIHRGTRTITTERLTLRRFTVDDAEAMFRNWADDERVSRYMTWEPHGDISVTRSLLENWVATYSNNAYYQWCIDFEGEMIGSISA